MYTSITKEEALSHLKKEHDNFVDECERLVQNYKNGDFSGEKLIKALAKYIPNTQSAINNANKFEFYMRGDDLFMYVPIVTDKYDITWDEDNQEWVPIKVSSKSSTGFKKPRHVPCNGVYTNSNLHKVAKYANTLNKRHVIPTYCKVCGTPFVVSLSEQIYLSDKGLEMPKRCPACRAKSKVRRITNE